MEKTKLVEYREEPVLPEIGERYVCFDDGKITRSRAYPIIIKKIARLADCPQNVIDLWRSQTECDWMGFDLFKNPHIVFATSYETEPEEIYLAPAGKSLATKPYWFGIGNWFGMGNLDLDGTLCASIGLDPEEVYQDITGEEKETTTA